MTIQVDHYLCRSFTKHHTPWDTTSWADGYIMLSIFIHRKLAKQLHQQEVDKRNQSTAHSPCLEVQHGCGRLVILPQGGCEKQHQHTAMITLDLYLLFPNNYRQLMLQSTYNTEWGRTLMMQRSNLIFIFLAMVPT